MTEAEFIDSLLVLCDEAEKRGKEAGRVCHSVGAAYRSGLVKIAGRLRMRQTVISTRDRDDDHGTENPRPDRTT